MEPKTRVNITDPLRLRRIEVAKNRIGAATATKAACALLDEKLTEMGIPLMPDEAAPATAREDGKEQTEPSVAR